MDTWTRSGKPHIGRERKNKNPPPKRRTAHPFPLLPGQTKPKVKIQDLPREKQQQLFCQSTSGLSYVNTEVPSKCLPNFRITKKPAHTKSKDEQLKWNRLVLGCNHKERHSTHLFRIQAGI